MERRTFLQLALLGGLNVLGRRLLIAGSGGAFAPPPPVVSSDPFAVTAAPDGAWSWFGDPRAIHYGSYSYIGYVDTSGNVCLRTLADNSETTGAEIVLHAALDVDDHVNPSFLARASDHKLMAFYARHEPASTTMHMRISTSSLDTDPTLANGFDAVVNLDAQHGGTSYDYPVPLQLSNGDIHLYYRDIPGSNSYRLTRSISTDGGATWGAQEHIYWTTYAYWKIRQVGDRIHFAVTNGSPNIGNVSVGHFYWEGGTFYRSDGTDMGAVPFDFADVTVAYDYSAVLATGWVWDIAVDGDGNPHILVPNFLFSGNHRYHRYSWNGSAWSGSQITTAGDGIDSTKVYSPGFCFDPADPDVVYTARNVSGQYEIWRYAWNGSSWDGTAITEDSSSKNIRPFVVGDLVIWLAGTYSGYTSFNMGISGYRP